MSTPEQTFAPKGSRKRARSGSPGPSIIDLMPTEGDSQPLMKIPKLGDMDMGVDPKKTHLFGALYATHESQDVIMTERPVATEAQCEPIEDGGTQESQAKTKLLETEAQSKARPELIEEAMQMVAVNNIAYDVFNDSARSTRKGTHENMAQASVENIMMAQAAIENMIQQVFDDNSEDVLPVGIDLKLANFASIGVPAVGNSNQNTFPVYTNPNPKIASNVPTGNRAVQNSNENFFPVGTNVEIANNVPTGIPTGVPTPIPTGIPTDIPTLHPPVDLVMLNSEVLLDARFSISHTIQRVFQIMAPSHEKPNEDLIMDMLTISPYLADIYRILGADDPDDPELKGWIKRHRTIIVKEGLAKMALREGSKEFLRTMQYHGMPVAVLATDVKHVRELLRKHGLAKMVKGVLPNALQEFMDGSQSFEATHATAIKGRHSYRLNPLLDTPLRAHPNPNANPLSEILFVTCTPNTMLWARREGLTCCWLKVTDPPMQYACYDYRVESMGALAAMILQLNEIVVEAKPAWDAKEVEEYAAIIDVKGKGKAVMRGEASRRVEGEVETKKAGEKGAGEKSGAGHDGVNPDDDDDDVEIVAVKQKPKGMQSDAEFDSVFIKEEPNDDVAGMWGLNARDAELTDVSMNDAGTESSGSKDSDSKDTGSEAIPIEEATENHELQDMIGSSMEMKGVKVQGENKGKVEGEETQN